MKPINLKKIEQLLKVKLPEKGFCIYIDRKPDEEYRHGLYQAQVCALGQATGVYLFKSSKSLHSWLKRHDHYFSSVLNDNSHEMD